MREIVFLLEEFSAGAMLESLLPRLLKDGTEHRFIPFQGKQDLEKQLVRKIRSYQKERVRFIVLRDQDSHPDCEKVKNGLLELCDQSGKAGKCRVRIACKELEAFYLADLSAVEKALGIRGISQRQQSRKFRSPDEQDNPSRLLQSLTENKYKKIAGSRAIGQHLDMKNQRSSSFRNLVAAIVELEKELIAEGP
ncbi:MAG: DUF4276 family protein [Gammaproteobacteria bacterium]|nr:DUF4276 family protein [Gammaproteobacteria bacterium]MCY4228943.1 DUF4276 family protein [Gammaproteobacteria bacterium]MCY4314150.1 DUF4276 family protein [Gammaproteobacteria bacterium]